MRPNRYCRQTSGGLFLNIKNYIQYKKPQIANSVVLLRARVVTFQLSHFDVKHSVEILETESESQSCRASSFSANVNVHCSRVYTLKVYCYDNF